jgi:hypothetical protein
MISAVLGTLLGSDMLSTGYPLGLRSELQALLFQLEERNEESALATFTLTLQTPSRVVYKHIHWLAQLFLCTVDIV